MPDVWLGHSVLGQLRHITKEHIGDAVCVVADENTAAITRQAEEVLAETVKVRYIYPGQLRAEEAVVQQVQRAARQTDGLVSVGSGCITDVTRLAAFRMGKPFVAVATAASMDGYLSGHSPIIVNGYKLTCPAQPPRAMVADTQVLAEAPRRLTQAGLGDVLGKFTSLADWRLGHVMTGEYWCAALSKSVYEAVDSCRSSALRAEGAEASLVEATMRALLITGHAMVCAGNSRPASGGEHHISHYWEMQALARGEEGHLHGEHVAVGTVLLAAVYHAMMARERLAASAEQWHLRLDHLSDRRARQQRLEKGYGPAAESVGAETQGKDTRALGALSHAEAEARWTCSRRVLAHAVPKPAEIIRLLRVQGLAATPHELGIAPEDTEKALLYARELRNRFGILDAAAAAGCLEELARTIALASVSW
jgi:glycerol-1-phosphate dehydrogenase [NAD(P)+]